MKLIKVTTVLAGETKYVSVDQLVSITENNDGNAVLHTTDGNHVAIEATTYEVIKALQQLDACHVQTVDIEQ